VKLNLVRAGLVADAAEWRWSSTRSRLAGRDDRLATPRFSIAWKLWLVAFYDRRKAAVYPGMMHK